MPRVFIEEIDVRAVGAAVGRVVLVAISWTISWKVSVLTRISRYVCYSLCIRPDNHTTYNGVLTDTSVTVSVLPYRHMSSHRLFRTQRVNQNGWLLPLDTGRHVFNSRCD
jgi:hypothetical protein